MARLVALLLVVAGLSAPAARAGAPGPVCGPAADRSLAASHLARVYVDAGMVWGCTPGSPPRRLGRQGPCQGSGAVRAAAVSGRDAALAVMVCGVDTGETTVAVLRLTDGRTLSSRAAARMTAPESFTSVQGLVLAPDGTVAWIGRTDSIVRPGAVTRVYAAGPSRSAPVRTLDAGPGVSPGSLRLAGRTASWRHGPHRRSARL